jgi:rSAM/selenodomain-associated transferase 2
MDIAATPAISIIVPVLNEAATVLETLALLQPLRERGHEVIVVDGGSDDATRDIASPLADRLLHAPRGRARQLQAGAEASRGEILWFLHADTQVPEDCDRLIINALRSGGWGRFDVHFPGGGLRMRLVASAMNLRSRLTGIATGDQGIFASRALFGRVNGYPDIPLMEDIALCRALRRETRPVCLRTRLGTSPRRWQTGGYLRTVLLMWGLRLGYFIGVPPARLAKYYANGPR